MTFDEQMARYLDATPSIHPTAFIAPGAVIVGDVTVGRGGERLVRRGSPGGYQPNPDRTALEYPGWHGRSPGR